MSGISVDKAKLGTALSNYQTLSSNLTTKIGEIRTALDVIEKNWSGPEHNAAASDKENAETNMKDAIEILGNMETAVTKLSANANKIEYNG